MRLGKLTRLVRLLGILGVKSPCMASGSSECSTTRIGYSVNCLPPPVAISSMCGQIIFSVLPRIQSKCPLHPGIKKGAMYWSSLKWFSSRSDRGGSSGCQWWKGLRARAQYASTPCCRRQRGIPLEKCIHLQHVCFKCTSTPLWDHSSHVGRINFSEPYLLSKCRCVHVQVHV